MNIFKRLYYFVSNKFKNPKIMDDKGKAIPIEKISQDIEQCIIKIWHILHLFAKENITITKKHASILLPCLAKITKDLEMVVDARKKVGWKLFENGNNLQNLVKRLKTFLDDNGFSVGAKLDSSFYLLAGGSPNFNVGHCSFWNKKWQSYFSSINDYWNNVVVKDNESLFSK